MAALGLSACASGGGNKPTGSGAGGEATPTGGGNGGDISGAGDNLADVSSYKFTMNLVGEDWNSSMSAFGATAGDAGFTIAGTIMVKPEPAADITFAGINMIEVGGFQYIDMTWMGMAGYVKSVMEEGDSLADSFAPSQMFDSMMGGAASSDFEKVGTEDKNGVQANHYKATAAAAAGFGDLANVEADTWASDLWIATSGGYPVSMSIVGTKSGAVVYRILFEVSKVNDASNKVTAPTNIVDLGGD